MCCICMEYFPGPYVCVHLDIPPEMGVGAGPGRAGVGKQMIIDYSAFFVFLHSSDSSGIKARKKRWSWTGADRRWRNGHLGWRRHRVRTFDYQGIYVEDEGEVVMPGQMGTLTIMSCQQTRKSTSMKEMQPTYLPISDLANAIRRYLVSRYQPIPHLSRLLRLSVRTKYGERAVSRATQGQVSVSPC